MGETQYALREKKINIAENGLNLKLENLMIDYQGYIRTTERVIVDIDKFT